MNTSEERVIWFECKGKIAWHMALNDMCDEDGHNDSCERRELHEASDHRVQIWREVQHVRVEACSMYCTVSIVSLRRPVEYNTFTVHTILYIQYIFVWEYENA